jgi:acetyltransferase-like isoleucine patch superfamily enzyme
MDPIGEGIVINSDIGQQPVVRIRVGHGPTVVSAPVMHRPLPDHRLVTRVRGFLTRCLGEVIQWGWAQAVNAAAIGPLSRRGRGFGAFGERSVICFPHNTIMNERYIRIGSGTMIGPGVTLSAGMVPGQECMFDPVVEIGDRCLIGKGSGIVGHLQIRIGDDVWTGHHVYITDQNHGYADPDLPISQQTQPERPVTIGDGSWIGHGSVILPGARIGAHVVIGANSVVTGDIPDFSVAVGAPAKVISTRDPKN